MLISKQTKINLKNIKWKSDAIYNSFWISKIVSNIFKNGKKVKVETTLQNCFYNIRLQYTLNAVYLFFEALEFIKTLLNLVLIKKRARGKIIFPRPTLFLKQYKKVISSISNNVLQNAEQTLYLRLTNEFMLLVKKQSSLHLKKKYIIKISCQNQALKRYRWET